MTLFWLLWCLTGLVAMRPLVLAARSRERALGFPVVAGLMWLYVYVILPYQVVTAGDSGLSEETLTLAQLTALVAFAALQLGWDVGLRPRPRRDTRPSLVAIHYSRLWRIGLGLQGVGLLGYYTFVASGRSFDDTSAYWYLLFHLCYPGISLCAAVLGSRAEFRTWLNWGILATSAALNFLPFLLNARRGPTFTALVALTFAYLICRQSKVSVAKVAGFLVAVGLLMLLQLAARRIVYDEGRWPEALSAISLRSVVEDHGRKTSDNEFVNHALQIEANLETGRYQYGTAHLNAPLNAIPRRFWPDKPARGEGLFPEAMPQHATDVAHNLGHGGAIAAVADSFNNYGWAFPVFWLLVGYGLAALYRRALSENSIRWKLHYVGVLCASHWFIAQSLAEAFVPAVIYQVTFLLAFLVSVEELGPYRRANDRPTRAPSPEPVRSGGQTPSEHKPAPPDP